MRSTWSWLVLAFAALTACEAATVEVPPTTVFVRIRATSEVQGAMRKLRLRVASNASGSWAVEQTQEFAASELQWPVDYPVTSTTRASASSLFELMVEALDAAGDPLVQSRAISGFVPKQTRALEMELKACGDASDARGLGFVCKNKSDCIGESCKRCVNGECVATMPVDGKELDAFEAPSAATDGGGDQTVRDAGVDAGAPEYAIVVYDTPCSKKGAKACEGNNSSQPLFCSSSGRWDFGNACQGATRCQALATSKQVGTCQAIVPACLGRSPGDFGCDGSQRRRCGADLVTDEPAPCGANASCVNGAVEATCVCNDEHTGNPESGCMKVDDCALTPCQNGGACADGLDSRTCDCSKVDYAGTSCESKIDDCAANPCQNGGLCTDGVRSRTCDCSGLDYSGTSCESKIDHCAANPCLNGGECTDGVRSRTCDCSRVDYSGTNCESKIDACADEAPCGNGGICSDGVRSHACDCGATGYSGPTCDIDVNECKGGNACTGDYPCQDLAPFLTFYTCRGQFPEWNVSAASSFWVSNGIVGDSLTQLGWQQAVDARAYDLSEAKAYCANLVLDNNSDWRLPTITELRSIVDYSRVNPAINTTAFPSTPSERFWSASPAQFDGFNGWFVGFTDGASITDAPHTRGRVRCVRGYYDWNFY